MSTMTEHVSLPDPSAHPLLHPAEVEAARPSFTRGWAMSLLGSAEVVTLIAATAWWLSGSWVAPTLAGLSTGVIAELARRHLLTEAWGHIPRKRQDLVRPTPLPFSLIDAAVRPIALAVATLVILSGLVEHDTGVRSWALGAAVGLGVAMVLAAAQSVVSVRGSATALGLVVSALSVFVAGGVVLMADLNPTPLDTTSAVLSGVVIAAVYALWSFITRAKRTPTR